MTSSTTHLRAFTLLELLLALALFSALLAMMFTFLFDITNTRDRAASLSSQHRGLTTLIERIEADLLSAVATDARHGAGFVGTSQTLSVTCRSISPHIAANDHATPAFIDACRLEVVYAPAQQTLTMRRAPHTSPSPAPQADFSHLADNIGLVQLRYHDGESWRDAFNSADAGGLPRAVEVSIWLTPPDSSNNPDAASEQSQDADPDNPDRANTNFDEFAHAMSADTDQRILPPPDRLRVITTP